jgi:HEAT repeat protein
MNTDEALAFLKGHQPLPATDEISEALLRRFDEVCAFFAENPDERCVGLLLNAFGRGDGHGVYQMVEDTILKQDRNVVISALQQSLANRSGSVRFWSAQIAALFPSPLLIVPLVQVLAEGDDDERMAAVMGLEGIRSPEVVAALERALRSERDPEVQGLIHELLAERPSNPHFPPHEKRNRR